MDWESGKLYANWIAISPLLKHWIREEARMTDWQYEIVCGLMDYEAHRLHFLSGASLPTNGILASGENWVAFRAAVHLNQTLEKLRNGSELTPEVLQEGLVALVRYALRKLRCLHSGYFLVT